MPATSTLAITRAVPDVRSTNIEKTVRFYTELIGFEKRLDGDRVVGFRSPTHDNADVTLNRDGFQLPPGFSVEIAPAAGVATLYERARERGIRIIEDLTAGGSQFSVLDPGGRRVTITGCVTPATNGATGPAGSTPGSASSISRSMPSVATNNRDAAVAFYVDFLGFDLYRDHEEIILFRSATAPNVQVIGSPSTSTVDGFDLDVGSVERVDEIYRNALGNCVVFGEPTDFPEQNVRCVLLLDPNAIGVNIAARLNTT